MEFKTDDIYLAAYLRIHEVPLVRVHLEPVADRWLRAHYIFEETTRVREVVGLYGQSITTVNLHYLRDYIQDTRYHVRRAVDNRPPDDDGPRQLMH